MSRTVATGVVLIGLGLAAVGCAGGTPTEASADPFPPRPRTVDVSGLDPCRSIDAGRARTLGVVDSRRSDRSPIVPGCTFSQASGDAYVVLVLSRTGARALAPGYPGQQGQADLRDPAVTTLDGFGAVQARLVRGSPADCAITLDTGADSSIQYVYSALDPSADVESGCDKAREFA
ncbi:MAG: DUF3558 family protein, partial [Pseudonocardia sediminis]